MLVNLCHINQPEGDSFRSGSLSCPSPLVLAGTLLKPLVGNMQMIKVEMSHSGSLNWETLPIFHYLGTEQMEEGAVLQVIQLFLQYLRALDAIFSSFWLPWQQMQHFFHKEKKKKKKGTEAYLVLSDIRKICFPDLASLSFMVVTL